MDWRENLAGLRDLLPEGEEPEHSGREEAVPAKKDKLHVSRSVKGRAGKTATIVEGFTVSDEEVGRVAAALRKKLGTGGSSRGGEILIQGDRRDEVATLLVEMGYKTTKS